MDHKVNDLDYQHHFFYFIVPKLFGFVFLAILSSAYCEEENKNRDARCKYYFMLNIFEYFTYPIYTYLFEMSSKSNIHVFFSIFSFNLPNHKICRKYFHLVILVQV